MKKQSLLFYAICLLFALAAKGSQGFTFDTQDSLSFEGKSYHNIKLTDVACPNWLNKHKDVE